MSSMVESFTGALGDRARALRSLGDSAGVPFAYQWSIPGRNARPVLPMVSTVLSGEAGNTTVALYTVPHGFRFFLAGVLVQLFGDGWLPGSPDLVVAFVCTGASGDRKLQYLNSIKTPLGSVERGPFPLPMTLQFVAGDVLAAAIAETGVVPSGGRLLTSVYGWEVPESELFL